LPGIGRGSLADVELRQLRHVVAVAEHRHFRRAALALGMTQPSLSRQT
jgi:DNA-binding transcriptional LysR family regulator